MRSTRPERQHASRLRRLLAENNIDYDKLKTAYEDEAKEGLQKLLQAEVWLLRILCFVVLHVILFFVLVGSECKGEGIV